MKPYSAARPWCKVLGGCMSGPTRMYRPCKRCDPMEGSCARIDAVVVSAPSGIYCQGSGSNTPRYVEPTRYGARRTGADSVSPLAPRPDRVWGYGVRGAAHLRLASHRKRSENTFFSKHTRSRQTITNPRLLRAPRPRRVASRRHALVRRMAQNQIRRYHVADVHRTSAVG